MGIISKDKREYYRKICDLTIVADHTFYKEVGGGNLDKTGVFHIITKRCCIHWGFLEGRFTNYIVIL